MAVQLENSGQPLMLSEHDSLREFGGAELLRWYPDRGLIPDSNWYQATLTFDPADNDELSRLDRFSVTTHVFPAVLSTNADGLRVFVATEQFATFIPWSDATVTAERISGATRVRLRTAAISRLDLILTLDDLAADDLFQPVVTLPLRAARLYNWTESWTWPAIATVVILAAVLVWIVLSTE